MQLPTLNLSHYIAGTGKRREQFVKDLLNSFDQTGFVKLSNHGFSEERLKEMFTWSKMFFDQSLELKKEISGRVGPNPMRGYMEMGIERTSKLHTDENIRVMLDAKEHFDQGPIDDIEYPNKWPANHEFATFQPFMELFYKHCEEVCILLINAIETGLGVEYGSLVKHCMPSGTDLRLTHYPPIPVEELKSGHTSRIAPHSDFGIITLLFQDSVGGLEIEDRSNLGTYVPVLPSDTTEMVVNVGDTLQHWTNAKLTGGVHRVTIPEAMKEKNDVVVPERFTAAFLFKAERNVSIGPLPHFVGCDASDNLNMTALEFQKLRNNTLYT